MLSKTYILAWAALIILLFGGCRMEPSQERHTKPNEQKPKVSEAVLPTTFNFHTGGMRGWYRLEWDGEALRYKVSDFRGTKITKTVTPSAEQW